MRSAVEEQGSVLGILRLLGLVSGGNDAKWTWCVEGGIKLCDDIRMWEWERLYAGI